ADPTTAACALDSPPVQRPPRCARRVGAPLPSTGRRSPNVTQQNDDFISFEKALRDLRMQSEELKKHVSEGEIRAFRDGDSMKFRREDLEALRAGGTVEEELVFAESLEDDAGMQTEELSDEDTLLADDEEEEEVVAVRRTTTTAATARPSRARAAVEEAEKEPGWVGAVAILSFVLMLWAFMVTYDVAMERPP